MTNPARAKGTAAETLVVDYLRGWWPDAIRAGHFLLSGGKDTRKDRGDIRGIPGICWQIKSWADVGRAVAEGMRGAERQAVPGELPVAVIRRRQKPVQDWYAVIRLEDFCRLTTHTVPSSDTARPALSPVMRLRPKLAPVEDTQ